MFQFHNFSEKINWYPENVGTAPELTPPSFAPASLIYHHQ